VSSSCTCRSGIGTKRSSSSRCRGLRPLRCPNGMQTRCQSEHGTSSLLSGPQQLSPAHNDWNVDSKSGRVTGDRSRAHSHAAMCVLMPDARRSGATFCAAVPSTARLRPRLSNPNGVVRVSGHHGHSCSPPSPFEPLEELVGGGPASGAMLTAALGPALISQRRIVDA
jgi:hypothetical protein